MFKPNRIVKCGDRLYELISYPYPEGETERVKVRDPGDPTTLTDLPTAELKKVVAKCCRCQTSFEPIVEGENKLTRIVCYGCARRYYAVHDKQGTFLGRFECEKPLTFVEK